MANLDTPSEPDPHGAAEEDGTAWNRAGTIFWFAIMRETRVAWIGVWLTVPARRRSARSSDSGVIAIALFLAQLAFRPTNRYPSCHRPQTQTDVDSANRHPCTLRVVDGLAGDGAVTRPFYGAPISDLLISSRSRLGGSSPEHRSDCGEPRGAMSLTLAALSSTCEWFGGLHDTCFGVTRR